LATRKKQSFGNMCNLLGNSSLLSTHDKIKSIDIKGVKYREIVAF